MAGTSEISLTTFSVLRDTVARKFYHGVDLEYLREEEVTRSLYMVDSMPNGTGDQRVYHEMDGETFARYKAEGSDARKVQVALGYTKTMQARRYAAEIDITAEARMFGKEREILRKVTDLSNFLPQRRSIDMQHRITFALATSYTDMDGESITTTGGDGLAVVSSVHTLTESTSTWSNVITGNPEFSQGALEVALNVGRTNILNNFGGRRHMNFKTIFSTGEAAVVRRIRQLLNSESDTTQNNSGVLNDYKGRMRHVILQWLDSDANGALDSTKSKYWGLIADGDWEAYLGIWEPDRLISPSSQNNGEDLHNDNWTYGARGTWGLCIVSGKGLLLSTGLGA